jgi:hypothetical protein
MLRVQVKTFFYVLVQVVAFKLKYLSIKLINFIFPLLKNLKLQSSRLNKRLVAEQNLDLRFAFCRMHLALVRFFCYTSLNDHYSILLIQQVVVELGLLLLYLLRLTDKRTNFKLLTVV